MNILDILKNLYTNKNCSWINEIEDTDIQPYVIQRWLAMNDMLRVQIRWLDKYVFVLTPKMYLSLAWSIIPKTPRQPFVKYIKQVEDDEEYDFILSRVRKHFKLSDNDYNAIKNRIVEAVKKDIVGWFTFYGVPKRFWKKYYIDFNLIKKTGDNKFNNQSGLEAWGL